MKKLILIFLFIGMGIVAVDASGGRDGNRGAYPGEEESSWWQFWKSDDVGNDSYKPEHLRQQDRSNQEFFEEKMNPHVESPPQEIPIDGGFMCIFAFVFSGLIWKLKVRGHIDEGSLFDITLKEAWTYAGVMIAFLAILGPLAHFSEHDWNLNWLMIPWMMIVASLRLRVILRQKQTQAILT